MATTTAPLTDAQKRAVYDVIFARMDDDDRHPVEVINDPDGRFKGDEDAYLRCMADWHGINLDATADSAPPRAA